MKHLIFCILLLSFKSATAQYSLHESFDLSPTAFNLQKGENRLTNTMLIGTGFTHGISTKLSFNVGILGLPKNIRGKASMKYTQTLHKNVSVGISPTLLYSESQYSFRGDTYSAGLTGILTIGKPDLFINFNYSKGFSVEKHKGHRDSEHLEITDTYTHYSVGGAFKISKNISLFIENIFLLNDNERWDMDAFHSIKGRWSFKPNQQIQVGFTCIIEFYEDSWNEKYYKDADAFCLPLPVISYSYYWGLKKSTQESLN